MTDSSKERLQIYEHTCTKISCIIFVFWGGGDNIICIFETTKAYSFDLINKNESIFNQIFEKTRKNAYEYCNAGFLNKLNDKSTQRG